MARGVAVAAGCVGAGCVGTGVLEACGTAVFVAPPEGDVVGLPGEVGLAGSPVGLLVAQGGAGMGVVGVIVLLGVEVAGDSVSVEAEEPPPHAMPIAVISTAAGSRKIRTFRGTSALES
ncbi:MAG: hypothetical protein WD557_06555 [Dehalococcoidia bacterium]